MEELIPINPDIDCSGPIFPTTVVGCNKNIIEHLENQMVKIRLQNFKKNVHEKKMICHIFYKFLCSIIFMFMF